MMRRVLLVSTIFAVWVACGDEPGPTEVSELPLYYLKAPTNSGDGQSDTVLTTLPLPFRVLVRRGDQPASGVDVIWEIDGDTLTGVPTFRDTSRTDDAGIATSPFRLTLGSRAGPYAVRARIPGVFNPGPLQYFTELPCGSGLCFTATARPGRPRALQYMSGRGQFGTLGTALDSNYVVQARDAYGNPSPGVVIDWAVTAGGGSVTPSQGITTGAQALAVTRHTLGSAGDTQAVRASAAALVAGAQVEFTATGFSALPVASVTMTPESATVATDRTKQFSVVLRDANGSLVIRRQVTWTTLAPSVATVDTSGKVRGASPGSTAVTAESEGVSDTAMLTVTEGPPPVIFASLAAGSSHTCGLRADSTAHCWGDNSSGQLGISSTLRSTTPVAVSGGLRFTQLVAGGEHTCGLTAAGVAYCWGRGDDGQLGNGSFTNRSLPIQVAGGRTFSTLGAGSYHTCGVLASGSAYCWGWNWFGQLGNGSSFSSSALPTAVQGSLQFTGFGTKSGWHTCGIITGGIAYCWGHNSNGELGDGSFDPRSTPVAVSGSLSFTSIAPGTFHTCALTGVGTVYCWGDNHWGELGDGFNGGGRPVPGPVPGVSSVASITSSGHTCVVSNSGIASCWGQNYEGQIGDGSSGSEQMTPAAVGGNLTFAVLVTGGSHTCGLTVAGVTYCWGLNQSGQLGDGTTTSSPLPVRVVSEPLSNSRGVVP